MAREAAAGPTCVFQSNACAIFEGVVNTFMRFRVALDRLLAAVVTAAAMISFLVFIFDGFHC